MFIQYLNLFRVTGHGGLEASDRLIMFFRPPFSPLFRVTIIMSSVLRSRQWFGQGGD